MTTPLERIIRHHPRQRREPVVQHLPRVKDIIEELIVQEIAPGKINVLAIQLYGERYPREQIEETLKVSSQKISNTVDKIV